MLDRGGWSGQPFDRTAQRLSILDLIDYGTIEAKLAGMLMLLMEHRASVLVAASPSFAGKTTLLHALLDLLPPQVQLIPLRGDADLKNIERRLPTKTYLVAEEFSSHGYEYIWGYPAIRAFELMSHGHGLGGTIHASSPREIVNCLRGELGLPFHIIAQLGLLINLRVTADDSANAAPLRRVEGVHLLLPAKTGVVIQPLVVLTPQGGFNYAPAAILREAIAGKFGIKPALVLAEITKRTQWLNNLHAQAGSAIATVRQAVADYYLRKAG